MHHYDTWIMHEDIPKRYESNYNFYESSSLTWHIIDNEMQTLSKLDKRSRRFEFDSQIKPLKKGVQDHFSLEGDLIGKIITHGHEVIVHGNKKKIVKPNTTNRIRSEDILGASSYSMKKGTPNSSKESFPYHFKMQFILN